MRQKTNFIATKNDWSQYTPSVHQIRNMELQKIFRRLRNILKTNIKKVQSNKNERISIKKFKDKDKSRESFI